MLASIPRSLGVAHEQLLSTARCTMRREDGVRNGQQQPTYGAGHLRNVHDKRQQAETGLNAEEAAP